MGKTSEPNVHIPYKSDFDDEGQVHKMHTYRYKSDFDDKGQVHL